MAEEKQEGSGIPQVPGLQLRYTIMEDVEPLKQWLQQPGMIRAFPMSDPVEVDESARHWIGFSKYKSSLTATVNGKPVGIATLCLMPYRKLAHQCLLSIIVSEEARNIGVGTVLMNNLLHLAKDFFGIEVVYLEVYEDNPAISLYKRFGFKEIGFQKHFMKNNGDYSGKIIMERIL